MRLLTLRVYLCFIEQVNKNVKNEKMNRRIVTDVIIDINTSKPMPISKATNNRANSKVIIDNIP